MKKIMLVIIIILIFTTGCSNNDNMIYDEIEGAGYEIGLGRIVCEEIKDAVYLNKYYFITSEGIYYKFNESKLFSNEKNCIATDIKINDFKFEMFGYIFDKNIKLLYVYDGDSGSLVEPSNPFNINGYYDNSENADFISFYDGTVLLRIKDNEVYYFKKNNGDKISLGFIPEDEKILLFNGAVIKTDKNYYMLTSTNEDECNKYADIKCEYKFVRSELSNIYDKIIFVSTDYIIVDNYRIFGRQSYYTLPY